MQFNGLTGPIKFKEGKRVDFKLDLLKLKTAKLTKVGVDDHIGLMILRRVIMKRSSVGWRVDPAGWSCDHG